LPAHTSSRPSPNTAAVLTLDVPAGEHHQTSGSDSSGECCQAVRYQYPFTYPVISDTAPQFRHKVVTPGFCWRPLNSLARRLASSLSRRGPQAVKRHIFKRARVAKSPSLVNASSGSCVLQQVPRARRNLCPAAMASGREVGISKPPKAIALDGWLCAFGALALCMLGTWVVKNAGGSMLARLCRAIKPVPDEAGSIPSRAFNT
jgi:hypothetical protein